MLRSPPTDRMELHMLILVMGISAGAGRVVASMSVVCEVATESKTVQL